MIDGDVDYVLHFASPASPVDYLDSYGAMLESAGFNQTTFFESEGNLSAFYEGGVWVVTVAGAASPDGMNTITIGVNAAG